MEGVESSRNLVATIVSYFEDKKRDYEKLETPISSEDEISKRNFRKFKLSENDEQVRYHVGQIFENVELVKTSMKEYILEYMKNVFLKKNERKKIVVKCTIECPYSI